ncbi:DUF7638 domain-containing protein [Aquimarina sp. 2201CG14-23]|uniref:DUF7638 domain-containing protein n=1 Tax=Aquimarina mycalae TaxID=3040073 RepID=UPI0024781081|nr:hypothetical protein [Aquimarina sp. 2201CG14-23]MDH7447607.1 hypothetical protein [Aquimarina sp. 2201CG14-23]
MEYYKEKLYIEKNGKKIFGKKLPVIINNNGYYLSYITIFEDGCIDCWGLKDIDQIKSEITSGKLLQTIPDHVELECSLGTIKSSGFIPEKSNEDFIKEIEDIINELNNRDNRRIVCEKSFKKYLIEPSESNLKSLTDAYHDLPAHQKVIFEYIDEKDPLCNLMNGSEEFTLTYRKSVLKHYFKIELE